MHELDCMAYKMCTVFLLPFKYATLLCSSREVQTTLQCVHAGFQLFLAASMSSSRPWDHGAARYKRLDDRFVETKKKDNTGRKGNSERRTPAGKNFEPAEKKRALCGEERGHGSPQ